MNAQAAVAQHGPFPGPRPSSPALWETALLSVTVLVTVTVTHTGALPTAPAISATAWPQQLPYST